MASLGRRCALSATSGGGGKIRELDTENISNRFDPLFYIINFLGFRGNLASRYVPSDHVFTGEK